VVNNHCRRRCNTLLRLWHGLCCSCKYLDQTCFPPSSSHQWELTRVECRRLEPFYSKVGEPWFTGPALYPLKLAGFWFAQTLWSFAVLLPVTVAQAEESRGPMGPWGWMGFALWLFFCGYEATGVTGHPRGLQLSMYTLRIWRCNEYLYLRPANMGLHTSKLLLPVIVEHAEESRSSIGPGARSGFALWLFVCAYEATGVTTHLTMKPQVIPGYWNRCDVLAHSAGDLAPGPHSLPAKLLIPLYR
jgi:hypothetical protein